MLLDQYYTVLLTFVVIAARQARRSLLYSLPSSSISTNSSRFRTSPHGTKQLHYNQYLAVPLGSAQDNGLTTPKLPQQVPYNQHLHRGLGSVVNTGLITRHFVVQNLYNQHLRAHLRSIHSARVITSAESLLTRGVLSKSIGMNTYRNQGGCRQFRRRIRPVRAWWEVRTSAHPARASAAKSAW